MINSFANTVHVLPQAPGRRLIGESAAMRRMIEAVERVAERDVTVLIQGETGTGKELVAAHLHAHSRRARRPFVRFNCAAIPGELAESELFGHVKGAFTGAVAARQGFFAEADGGTLVLDEVGELASGLQAKLLRALQEGEIQRLGASRPEKVDIRIVASTNRDLNAEVRRGGFREDFYYRLAVVELVVPPLRSRREDIPALAAEFARRYAEKFGLDQLSLSDALVERLVRYDWPGNVRQLENTIARLAALSTGGVIDGSGWEPMTRHQAAPLADVGNPYDGRSLREQVQAFERSLLERALAAAEGNQSEAARRLRTSRSSFFDRLLKYGITP